MSIRDESIWRYLLEFLPLRPLSGMSLSPCCFYPQGIVKTSTLHCNSDPRSGVIGAGLANEVGFFFFLGTKKIDQSFYSKL